MPVIVPASLPAIDTLKKDGCDVMTHTEGVDAQLNIAILNLMPIKPDTEVDFLRLLSASPLTLGIDFFIPNTCRPKHTSPEHIAAFYHRFSEIMQNHYDGMIITGAPLEMIDYEQVTYWTELSQIFDWAKTNVNSTLYVCWAAFAGLYHHHGIQRQIRQTKISGVFPHRSLRASDPLLRGFDDEYFVPHSRFVTLPTEEIIACPQLEILSESAHSGIYIVAERDTHDYYITGHSEYAPNTLDAEYRRDLAKGINPIIPENYYRDNNPALQPIVRWRGHAHLLFSNWVNLISKLHHH